MLSKPFPEPPSSPNVYIPPSFFFNREQDCVFFNHHLNNSDQILSGDGENITTINQQFSEGPVLQSGDQDHDELIDLVNSCTKNKTRVFKKDGKNKIYTAQGPRDRRVRLSIDISRKFFCLQDSLGFDKASKTVDWLFARCKTSIMELVEETNHCSSSTATDQSKMIFLESVMGSGLDKKKGKKKKSVFKKYDFKWRSA